MELLNPQLDGRLGTETRVRLDGVEYRVALVWLAEVARVPFYDPATPPPPPVFGDPGVWVLTLSQSDGTVLLAGQALRHGVNLLLGFRGDARFPGVGFGQLLAWDFSGQGRDPGRNDLDVGSSRRLVYLTAGEA